jgi:hypothetical protein
MQAESGVAPVVGAAASEETEIDDGIPDPRCLNRHQIQGDADAGAHRRDLLGESERELGLNYLDCARRLALNHDSDHDRDHVRDHEQSGSP